MNSNQTLVHALLLGSLEGLEEETVFLFARTGLIHLFAASGVHLFVAYQLVDFATSRCTFWVKDPKAKRVLGFAGRLGFLLFFGRAVGWSSPMVRASAFSVLTAGASLLEIRADRNWIFLLSLVVSAALGKGGSLSLLFTAFGMAGVLYVKPRTWWAMALGPWLFTLPLTLLYFGSFSLLAPLWNLTYGVAVSWLVLPLAILSLTFSHLGIPTAYLDSAAGLIVGNLTSWLRVAADYAGFAYWVRPYPWLLLAGGGAFALWCWEKRRRKGMLLACLACLAALLWPLPVLTMLDVGQGDALLLRGKELVLSDVGPPGYLGGLAPVIYALEAQGRGDIEEVMLSHFDLDHRGGLDSLLARHRVKGGLWFREVDLQDKRADLVIAAAERVRLPIRFITNKEAPEGMKCWLAPFAKGNDSSPLCLAELSRGKKILLTGDMSKKAEEWFVGSLKSFPQVEILKVAHHGSQGSSSPEFLKATKASTALVSVGARNRYHHPREETLERLKAAEMKIIRSDQAGTWNFYSWLGI